VKRSASACYCINLRRATQAVTRLYDEVLAPSGLRVTQYSLLRRIQRLGVASIGTLALEAELDRTTLTRNLKPLLDAGLVEQAPGTDRRSRPLRLAPAGAAALERALPLWHEAQQRVDGLMGREQAQALCALLAVLESAAADACAARPYNNPLPRRDK
jgi:DNA-binding MarR family transcriptional regulator